MSTERESKHGWWWAASLLTGFGLAASAYLLARTFALIAPTVHVAPDLCSALFSASCDATLSDPRAWVLGIPLAGWGLVYFSMLVALLALARFVAGAFEAPALLAASVLVAIGLGCGIVLTASALLGKGTICPVCLSIHALSLALLFALQRALARRPREQWAIVHESWRGLTAAAGAAPETSRWRLVGFGCVALVAAMAYQWVYVESALRRSHPASAPVDHAAVITAFRAAPERLLPVSASDPHRGPLDATVRLVVFESFQCPHCQRFAGALPRLEREFGDRLVVVFKHYPLSSRCNERLHVDMQPDACEIAWAAEAAHRQSRFWAFHDAMLAAGRDADANTIERAARGAGLELARFETDRRSAAVRERVAADIELGNDLGIPGTPAVYLDGRLVRTASPEVLEILIKHELGKRVKRTPTPDHTARQTARLDTGVPPRRTAEPISRATPGRREQAVSTPFDTRRFTCGG